MYELTCNFCCLFVYFWLKFIICFFFFFFLFSSSYFTISGYGMYTFSCIEFTAHSLYLYEYLFFIALLMKWLWMYRSLFWIPCCCLYAQVQRSRWNEVEWGLGGWGDCWTELWIRYECCYFFKEICKEIKLAIFSVYFETWLLQFWCSFVPLCIYF